MPSGARAANPQKGVAPARIGVYTPAPRRAVGDSHVVRFPRESGFPFELCPKLVLDCSCGPPIKLPTKEGAMRQTFAVAIGGAAGQGVATPGDIFAKIFSRRGLSLNAYNAYQSIIRGGHTLLTIRTGPEKVTNMGDRIDLLIPLNQDTMDRHLHLLAAGAACIYNADTIKADEAAEGVQMCPLPVSELSDITRNKVAQNTLALGAGLHMMGIGFAALEEVLGEQFKKKGEAVIAENVGVARAGYDYAAAHFTAFPNPLPKTEKRYAVLSGNTAMAMRSEERRVGREVRSEW